MLKNRISPLSKRPPQKQSLTRVNIYIDLKNFDSRFEKRFWRIEQPNKEYKQFVDKNHPFYRSPLNKKLFSNYFEALGEYLSYAITTVAQNTNKLSINGVHIYTKRPHIDLGVESDLKDDLAGLKKMLSAERYGFYIDIVRNRELSQGKGLYMHYGYQNILSTSKYIKEVKPFLTGDFTVDAAIASDMIRDSNKDFTDIIVLITEDNDFTPIVKHITENLNKRVFACEFSNPNKKGHYSNSQRNISAFERHFNLWSFTKDFISNNWTKI